MIQKRARVCPDGVEYPKCGSLLKTGINLIIHETGGTASQRVHIMSVHEGQSGTI